MSVRYLLSAFVLHVSISPSAFGGESSGPAPTLPPAPEAPSVFSTDLGLTIANQYNTRGIIVQDQDVTFQPYLNLYANLYRGDGFLDSASVFIGLWADVSSNGDVSGPGNQGSGFTEFDYGVGLSFSFAERWSFTTFFNNWTSPADAYGDGRWWNAKLAFNDKGLLSDHFSVNPYLIVLRDLGGDASTGLVGNTWYFEPGIQPTYTFFPDSPTPLSVGILAKAGLGNDFYNGETFGYFAAGPQISVPLGFVDPRWGKWTASAGYLYYTLGNTLEPIRGDDTEHFVSFNLGVSF